MCISSPKYSAPAATPMPTAQPMAITSTNNDVGQAMLSQYMNNQKRKGLQSTVRSGAAASNQTLNTGGSANNLTLG